MLAFKISFHSYQKKYKKNKYYQHPDISLVVFFMEHFISAITEDHYYYKHNKENRSENKLSGGEHKSENLWV